MFFFTNGSIWVVIKIIVHITWVNRGIGPTADIVGFCSWIRFCRLNRDFIVKRAFLLFRFRFYLKNAVLTKLYRFRQIIRNFTDKTDIYWIDLPLWLLSIHKCIIDNWKLGIERKGGKSQRLRVWKRGDGTSDTWSNHSIVHSFKRTRF